MSMTPEQFKHFLKDNERATGEAIQKYVNGKVDAISDKLDTHNRKHEKDMERILPIIEGIQGTKIVGKVFLWLAAIGVAYATLKNFKL